MEILRRHYRSILAVAGLTLLISFLWSPQMLADKNKGYVSLNWSGLSALFNKKDFGLKRSYYLETAFKGTDGPYVFRHGNSFTAWQVDSENRLDSFPAYQRHPLKVLVPNADADSFTILLRARPNPPASKYEMPPKLLVISDIEGNFNAFHSFLIRNGVIDKFYNWTFGKGHLVLLGDFVDRGEEVTQVLWLAYLLEDLAKYQGAKVHFILGNHELMNINGQCAYADRKYVKAAQEISGKQEWDLAYKTLYAPNSVLGAWLRSKNCVEQIGDYTFVHGGFSTDMLKFNPDLDKLNKALRNSFDKNETDSLGSFLAGKLGPLWYRGMVQEYKDQKKMKAEDFERILTHLQTKKIVLGHSIRKDIERDYNGRLLMIDVKHGREKENGETRGLLIEQGIEYKVDDRGIRTRLSEAPLSSASN